jgi:LPS sulfotransferase NodH
MMSFLILSSARSGSSLLVNYLNCHASIRCWGEILNSDSGIDQNVEAMSYHQLCTYVASFFPHSGDGCVGAKLLNHQFDELPLTLSRVIELSNWPKVIVLYRQNLLEAFVSLRIAQANNIWYSTDQTNNQSLSLDWTSFEMYAHRERSRWARCLSELPASGCKVRFVTYEQMVDNPQATLDSLFVFLGLDTCEVRTESVRQNPGNLSEKVENWSCLPVDSTQAASIAKLELTFPFQL